jgi:aspartyl-tRNA(Asn)/glutamyl-tRNA(Gln) amidotransferase subunit C
MIDRKIDRKEIENIASLVKLDISRANGNFIEDIKSMIQIMDEITQIDLPLPSGDYKINTELVNTFREDEGKVSLPREAVLANAPRTEAGCISIPKTLGKEE